MDNGDKFRKQCFELQQFFKHLWDKLAAAETLDVFDRRKQRRQDVCIQEEEVEDTNQEQIRRHADDTNLLIYTYINESAHVYSLTSIDNLLIDKNHIY